MPARVNRYEVLGVGDAARITGVSTRTVQKWIDSGNLAGWKMPTAGTGRTGRHRRVHRDALIAFMHRHNMPSSDPSFTLPDKIEAPAETV